MWSHFGWIIGIRSNTQLAQVQHQLEVLNHRVKSQNPTRRILIVRSAPDDILQHVPSEFAFLSALLSTLACHKDTSFVHE